VKGRERGWWQRFGKFLLVPLSAGIEMMVHFFNQGKSNEKGDLNYEDSL
jgi:hypothetical protein